MDKLTAFGIVTAVLFALLPFATSRHLFHAAVNIKHFLVVSAVLLLAGAAAIFYFQGKQAFTLKSRPLLWAGALLLAVYWLAAFLGVFPERSLFADIQRSSGVFFLTHIAVLALLLGEFCTARDWTLIRRTIALSAGLFGFLTLVGAEGFGVSGRILWTNLDINGYTFGNSTFAGTYLVLALVVTLIELVRTPAWSRWWYALAGSVVLMVFSPTLLNVANIGYLVTDPILLLGSARSSSATAILLLIFFGGYLLLRKYGSAYAKYLLPAWGAAFVLAIVGGVALLFTPGSVVQEQYIEASSAARIVVWESGLEAFKERPLLGFGPENFERALQTHFDNRLFQREYLGEIWFDRAHNTVVDTLVTTGLAGVLTHLALAGAFVWVVYRARRQDVIGDTESAVLYALPAAHFLQLQTGFDTIGSFALLGVLGGYGLWLERSVAAVAEKDQHTHLTAPYYTVGAGVLIVLVVVSAYFSFSELNRQYSLYRLFVEPSRETQLELAEAATARLSSFESLRFASASLIKAVLEQMVEGKASASTIETALEQMQVYEERYRRYLQAEPEHYRARINFAYLLSIETALGKDGGGLNEAKEIVAGAYPLSPNNLLAPAMDALLELYSGNFAAAREKAQETLALNPEAPLGKRVVEHLEQQEAKFPAVSVMRFEEI
ncbi:MAG: O-antigen ligase family protein [Candidatus Adlerbacteria bacterium]|nr:O-antigen ligase family protein [Candidatus Adlerbacteria bacterium]